MGEVRIVPQKNREQYIRQCEFYTQKVDRFVEMYNKRFITAMEFGSMIHELYVETDEKLKKLSKAVK